MVFAIHQHESATGTHVAPTHTPREEIRTQTHTEETSFEDTGRRQPSTSRGQRPQEKPTLPAP